VSETGSRNLHYRLDAEMNAVPTTSIGEWAEWFESADKERMLASTSFAGHLVSTVFVGIDQSWGEGPPLLWETMVFRLEDDGEICAADLDCDRYTTFEEAEAGHEAMVRRWTEKLASEG